MKTFHEIGLPKEYSKKKKLELYKCWIISKDSDLTKTINDSLDINQAKDYYGLTEKAAISLAVTDFMSDNPLISGVIFDPFEGAEDFGVDDSEISVKEDTSTKKVFSKMDKLQEAIYVIAKITLAAGSMDEDVIVLPENPDALDALMNWDTVDYYDKALNTIWCTIHNRISDCEIHNYRVNNIKLDTIKDCDNDDVYKVVDVDLSEIILKS